MRIRLVYRQSQLFYILTIITVLLVTLCSVSFASDNVLSDTAVVAVKLDDGPHVFLETDSTAIVFYYCNEAIESRTFVYTDTLYFSGFCNDTGFQYVVPPFNSEFLPEVYIGASKIFAISDIHGEYEHMADILRKGGVIDSDLHWSWGDGHLVVVGDIFDRGDKVTECLWFIYRLEQEARVLGGRVHTLLGNHEMMVLRGDDRYVNEKYLNGIARNSRIRHQDLYSPDMALGRWLRSKQVAIIINDILFVHAGISPIIVDSGLTLNDLNCNVHTGIDMRSSRLAFSEPVKFLLGSLGPLWYRGYHYEMENRYPKATNTDIDRILTHFSAKAIVVGHTEVDSLCGLYDNRIFAIDVPVDKLGSLQALLWENDHFYCVNGDGKLVPLE
ncbi:MAG: metallophosphoesterase [Candidatus Zixiibacteriota bacterium]|nr:MAG: metallophosphoesterase [candidate division Zixibacteria bacterium]